MVMGQLSNELLFRIDKLAITWYKIFWVMKTILYLIQLKSV